MKQRTLKWGVTSTGLLAFVLTGCASQTAPSAIPNVAQQPAAQVSEPQSVSTSPTVQVNRPSETDWVPPLFISPEEEAAYYVSRLADRRFVSRYGDSNNPRTWYIAAERLGQIGMPAVPLLYARLNSHDNYELMLVLYALQLATQDPVLMAKTHGDYIQLTAALDPSANTDNLRIAQQWWQQHSALLN